MLRTDAKPITADDYRDLPEGPPYCQLIEGDLCMAPSPDLFHQDIIGNLFFIIRSYLEAHPIGTAHLSPSDVYLTELNVYQPDLYFVSKRRKSILSDQGAEGAPDLVVEILSPRTARLDKGVKRQVYARTGVEELWLVDPDSKQIQVFHLSESADKPASTHKGREIFQSPLFPGLRISLAKVFQR